MAQSANTSGVLQELTTRGAMTKSDNHDDATLDSLGRKLMRPSGRQIENHQPAAAQAISPKSRKKFEVTISTDGTWFTLDGDKKDNGGFDLHFSTDGSFAELNIHTPEADSPMPALRLYRDRQA